jgi:hypothetical protein
MIGWGLHSTAEASRIARKIPLLVPFCSSPNASGMSLAKSTRTTPLVPGSVQVLDLRAQTGLPLSAQFFFTVLWTEASSLDQALVKIDPNAQAELAQNDVKNA